MERPLGSEEGGGDDVAVDTLVSITSLSRSRAQEFFRAFGGVEAASNAFFDGREPGEKEAEEGRENLAGKKKEPVSVPEGEYYGLVWGHPGESIASSWLEQDIKLINLGIIQNKNGPCGVLAAINAVLLAQHLEREGELDRNHVFTAEEFVDALASIVERCAPQSGGAHVNVAIWKDALGGDVNVIELMRGEEIREFMMRHLDAYIGAGSLCLLVYSAVFTRGLDRVKEDIKESDNEATLVVGPFWLCTCELLLLLIAGRASGSIRAYGDDGKKISLPPCQVGLLSYSEVETGVPIADELKSPVCPIWILHGGDHFTLLFSASRQHPPTEPESWFALYFWNGLPPGRSFQELRVFSESGPAGPAPDKLKRKWYKPRPGEIDEIIQAHPGDREKSDYYSRWRFEVILAVDDPDVKGKPRPPEMEKDYPILELVPGALDEEWRCASCYRTRYKTMCFGLNEPSTHCAHCGRSKEDAGWTMYVPYKQLPSLVRKKIQRDFGAKILSLVRCKWPDADIEFEDDNNLPSC